MIKVFATLSAFESKVPASKRLFTLNSWLNSSRLVKSQFEIAGDILGECILEIHGSIDLGFRWVLFRW